MKNKLKSTHLKLITTVMLSIEPKIYAIWDNRKHKYCD